MRVRRPDMTPLQLFEQHRAKLRAILHSRGLPAQDVSDVMQEVFLRFMLQVENGVVIENPPGYLIGIMCKVLADRARGRMPLPAQLKYAQSEVARLESREPEQLVESSHLLEQFHQLLQGLPDVEEAIVTLWYRDGLRYKEIGRMLDLSEHTVRKYLERAFAKLKQAMRDSGTAGVDGGT